MLLPDGPSQRLTIDGHNREPHWAESGEWIAYRKDRTVLIERDRPCEEPLHEGRSPCAETVSTFQQQVWLVRRTGTGNHVINQGFTVERFAWSPTNDLLAYVTDAGHLQTLDPATDISSRLVTAQGSGRVGAIAWSPDGLRVAYEWLSDEQGGPGANPEDGIWVVPTTGGQPVLLVRAGQSAVNLAGWRDPEHVLFWQHPGGTAPEGNVRLYSAALPPPGGNPPAAQVVQSEPMLQRRDFVAVSETEEHVDCDDRWGRPADLDEQASGCRRVPVAIDARSDHADLVTGCDAAGIRRDA